MDEFNDDLRGNFIQIVRKDLFRKDKPLDRYIGVGRERLDDGRPNFKKFKKVRQVFLISYESLVDFLQKSVIRRDPVRLVLAGPTLEDAEMGERKCLCCRIQYDWLRNSAYWPSETMRTGKRSQVMSQMPGSLVEDRRNASPPQHEQATSSRERGFRRRSTDNVQSTKGTAYRRTKHSRQ